jgi:hypothetical protein
MKPDVDVTRRRLLAAGVGGLGSLALAGNALAEAERVEYAQRRRVDAASQPDGRSVDLLVDWKEWYNGSVRERQDAPTSRAPDAAPLVTIPGVLPGDAGRVAFGLSLDAAQGQPPPMEIRMRVRETPASRAENGRTEPEEVAGDDTAAVGELQDELELLVWYDTGIAVSDVPLYGTCDAEFTLGDTKLVEGTLAEVSVTDEDGPYRVLDATPSIPDGRTCLRPGEGLCVGLEWTVPPDVGNRIQTDSVEFAIEFGARSCPQ